MSQGIYYPAFLNRDRRVHILDSDPAVCEALSVLFRLEGFQTQFSLSIDSFYADLERRRPDVVVVNLNLGGEDGLAILRRVKALRMGTPVFVLEDTPRVEDAVRLTRYGGDCYSYCMLAAGHLDLVIETELKPYDIAALIPIISGAGGIVTTWEGKPAQGGGRIIAAGDPRVHEAAMKLLNS